MPKTTFSQWAASRPVTGGRCIIGRIEDDLTGDEQSTFTAMLDDKRRKHTEIVVAIRDCVDKWLSAQAVGLHRNGNCSCYGRSR